MNLYGQANNQYGYGGTQTFNLQTGFSNPMSAQINHQQAAYEGMIRNALVQYINGSGGSNCDLITSANACLMQNGGQNQLMNGMIILGAEYVDYVVSNHHMQVQQAIASTASVLHGAIVASERPKFQHILHMFDQGFLANLERFNQEFAKIENVVRQVRAQKTQMAQPGYNPNPHNFQTAASLGGISTQVAPGVVILGETPQTADQRPRVLSAFDGAEQVLGMPTVGTIPTRQVRREDGTLVDFYSLTEEATRPNNQSAVGQNVILTDQPTSQLSSWDIRQQQIENLQRSSTIMQQQDNGEEIPISFKAPVYEEPRSPADDIFNDVFGAGSSGGAMPKAGWGGFRFDPNDPIDPDELARAGVISRGSASSCLNESVFDTAEDAYIAEHYGQQNHPNQALMSMEDYRQVVKNGEVYPSTKELSLMELTQQKTGTHEQGPIVEDFHSLPRSEKKKLLAKDRGIAPVYVAGRQRLVVIRSLGGGKVTVEGNKAMNYNLHETELLGPTQTALTGQLGNPEAADHVLTLAQTSANEQHYRKILEDKSKSPEDIFNMLVDGPMFNISGLVASNSVNEYAADVQAALHERLGDKMSGVSLDASINFTAFAPGKYSLFDDTLDLALSICRAKTVASINVRAEEFFEQGNFPEREQHRLHGEMTKEVNRLIQITFHPDFSIDSFIHDAEELSTVLHEEGYTDVRDKLQLIYQQAAKTVFSVYQLPALKKRLANAEELTGLTEGQETGLFGDVRNVTLLPFKYADYPVAFEGNIGRVTKEALPKLYEVMGRIIGERHAEGIYKFSVITEDHQIIEFFKPVLADDEALYIARN